MIVLDLANVRKLLAAFDFTTLFVEELGGITITALPEDIEAVSKRGGWDKPAPDSHALPTEIWREYIARRRRTCKIRTKLQAGEVCDINDLITLNLDTRQFAQDVIEHCEGSELLRAFWYNIVGRIPDKSNQTFRDGIRVLDSTCGSGAVLFAALNILEPLYDACAMGISDFEPG